MLSLRAHIDAGVAYLQMGNLEDAVAHFEHGLNEDDEETAAHDRISALLNLGCALSQLGHHAKAIAALNSALALCKSTTAPAVIIGPVQFNLAIALEDERKAAGEAPDENCVEMYRWAIHNGVHAARLNLGLLLESLSRTEEALRVYGRAAYEDPQK